MGWRGTLRSLEAAARASARESERRQKIALKAQVVASAAEAVAAWEEHVDNLTHVRGKSVDVIDWQTIAGEPPPSEPRLLSRHEDEAGKALSGFRPGFFDFLSGGSEKKRRRLQEALDRAPGLDAADFAVARNAYTKAQHEWLADTAVAAGVLRHDPGALKKVIEEAKPFSDASFIGSSIAFYFGEDFVHAVPTIHGPDIVPSVRLKQTSTGKLSETKMPVSQTNELYQDYVAGVPLRIAKIALSILPIKELYVTCRTMMLNTKTGHQELTPILSVQIVRDTLMRLDLAHVDASDALLNFNHSIQFKKTTGFQRVEPLKPIG